MIRFLYCFLSSLLTVTLTESALPIGDCVAQASYGVDPKSASFRCQLAGFGAYLPEKIEKMKFVLASGAQMLGCAVLSDQEGIKLENTAMIVRRGECSFQQKLAHVAAAGAALMVLINLDDSLVPLSSLEYEQTSTAALSITRNDGEMLIAMIKDHGDVELKIEIMSLVTQACVRLQYLVDINAPVVFFEEFYDVVEQFEQVVGTLDALLATIAAGKYKIREAFQREMEATELLDFFLLGAQHLSKWAFAREAALYATIGAAILQIRLWNENLKPSGHKSPLLLQTAARKLMESGYYAHGSSLFRYLMAHTNIQADATVQCLLSFLKFLQGDVVPSISDAASCKNLEVDAGVSSLIVAQDAFNQLIKLKRSSHDEDCLTFLTGTKNNTDTALTCCCVKDLVHTNTESGAHQFSSKFTEELFRSSVLMGVFLDELGSFDQSLIFFDHAARLCQSAGTTLELRQVLAIPIVFSSQTDVNMFLMELTSKVHKTTQTLLLKHHLKETVVLSLENAGMSSKTGLRKSEIEIFSNARLTKTESEVRPEHAAYLKYTITPSTMFSGYQGKYILPIQNAVYRLRSIAYPSLSSSFKPQTNNSIKANDVLKRRRVGFISSWFRAHSVGKLLLGVVQNLDRSKFQVCIYHCVHFLYGADEITSAFKRTADEYVQLPGSQDAAVALLRQAQLDIAIFPELGMDEWTVLLSHHRVALIQCVFWGHPITTGNPHIDYFISSEHFVSTNFDDPLENTTRDQLSGYRRSAFSEKIVLFRSLSTIFTKPKSLTTKAKAISRSRLYLPINRRLYLCPQTLMKLHPAFDKALAGIMDRDDKATIVLLASETQFVWVEQLRRRFRQHFGRNHRRILFLPTLPFDEFQALLTHADVLLDPFPFGGGVTTLDALHLGIPVVTLPTAQSVVHLAAGFLRYMNASDCIAYSLDEYVQKAVNVAKDHDDIRTRLLRHRSDIYQDRSPIEDWNKFLSTVVPRASQSQE